MTKFICKYCSKEYNKPGIMKNHQIRCRDNPDRIVQRGGGSGGWNRGLTKDIDPRVAHKRETKDKIRRSNMSREWDGHTDIFKTRQRERAVERQLGGVTQSRWIRYKNKTLGSSYELKVVKSLDENHIKWDTCKRFKYVDPNGKKRTYTPDIYLTDYDVYLDPKNDFLIENINPRLGFSDCEKIQLVQEQNNIRVLVLNKHELEWKVIETLL